MTLLHPHRGRAPRARSATPPGHVSTRTYYPSARSWTPYADARALDLPAGFVRHQQAATNSPALPGADELRIRQLMTDAIRKWGWLAR
ncbi:hypothetical protein [Streptomyces sp. NPDC093093]|uniref:hypothetical protein n=1 Tax=Streptomyces sp. NPDC093093 TaxID=3366025 RepID=UPI0037F19D8E